MSRITSSPPPPGLEGRVSQMNTRWEQIVSQTEERSECILCVCVCVCTCVCSACVCGLISVLYVRFDMCNSCMYNTVEVRSM